MRDGARQHPLRYAPLSAECAQRGSSEVKRLPLDFATRAGFGVSGSHCPGVGPVSEAGSTLGRANLECVERQHVRRFAIPPGFCGIAGFPEDGVNGGRWPAKIK